MSGDPTRWVEEGGGVEPALRAVVAAGRRELPDAAQLRSLAARLGHGFEPPPDASGGGSGSAPADAGVGMASAVTSRAIGALPVLATVAAAATAAALLWPGSPADPPSSAPQMPVVDAPARTPSEAPATPTAPPARPERSEPRRLEPDAPAQLQQRDRVAEPPRQRAHERQARGDDVDRHPSPATDPGAELILVEQAHAALAGMPARALALAESHAQRFPQGQYAQERELVAIEALASLGRADEARARAKAFLARFAGSTHARRVQRLLATLAPGDPSRGATPGPAP